MKTTKIISTIMVIISLALATFGYWGLCTQAGQKQYEGMAGLIPFYSLIAALIILLLTSIVGFILYRKTKTKALIVKNQ